jgi:hypothetical protein
VNEPFVNLELKKTTPDKVFFNIDKTFTLLNKKKLLFKNQILHLREKKSDKISMNLLT